MKGTHLMRSGRIETDVYRLNDDFQLPILEDLVQSKGVEFFMNQTELNAGSALPNRFMRVSQ